MSQVVFDRESGQTEKTRRMLYHSVIVLSSLYSLNVNNCHCGCPQE